MRKKKLTQKVAWQLTMRMWRWIRKQIKNGDRRSTTDLKAEYLKGPGAKYVDLYEWPNFNCWLCKYGMRYLRQDGYQCRVCPISKEFGGIRIACQNETAVWDDDNKKGIDWLIPDSGFFQLLERIDRKMKRKG